jgi:phenylacetate-coenzyme A ligase PaaK-like adenylate-forming protein
MDLIKFPAKKLKNVFCAAMNTDYYSEHFKTNIISEVNFETYDDFKNIPITTKSDYRENCWQMVNKTIISKLDLEYIKENRNDFKLIDSYLEKHKLTLTITSGSTGEPLEVIRSVSDEHRNYLALNKYRHANHNFSINEPYVWLLPMNQMTQAYFYNIENPYIINRNGFDYFLANYHEQEFRKLYSLIKKHNIRWMTGSPSCIYEFAKFLQKYNYSYNFSYIELHSEPSLCIQLKKINSIFNVIPACVYSSNEVLFIAATCSYGNYHILNDNVFLELIEVEGCRSNKVILTALNNINCPIIRYEIGDLAKYSDSICDCGKISLQLTGYRDSDLIRIGNNIFEPYIIYDSIFFLERSFEIDVGYYWVEQTSLLRFLYIFSNEVKWKEMKFTIAEYISNFLCSAFCMKVEVEIQFCNKKKMEFERKRKKYKRFTALQNRL